VKINAFMQQREREVKERPDTNLRDHKQAEAEKFQVFLTLPGSLSVARPVSGQHRSQESRYR
jgi:hypothetical protein